MKRKALTAAILALAVILSLCVIPAAAAGSMNNFSAVRSYADNFKDVSSSAWYYSNVKSAYEYNLITGTSKTEFAPDSYLTVAQAITMADRLHIIYYTGSNTLVNGDTHWYDTYVDYAVKNSIIKSGDFSNYDALATRAQVAYIFSRALPSNELGVINSVDTIPDVPQSHKYFNNILSLYRAGVLTGNDTSGTFYPDNNIKRSEAAAIMTRLAIPSLRREFTQYKTYTFGDSDSYAKVDVPIRFEYSVRKGIYCLQDTETSTVVTADIYSDDMIPGFTIDNLLTASDVEQLYIENFDQTSHDIVISSIKAVRADFGSVPAYRCRSVINYNGITVYSYSYLFIHDSNLFEITVASQNDDALTRSVVNSIRVLGKYSSSKV